jgi:hypothetical protein
MFVPEGQPELHHHRLCPRHSLCRTTAAENDEAAACRHVEADLVINGSPDYSNHLSDVPCPLPQRIKRVHMSIASLLMQLSPSARLGAKYLL